MREWAEFTSEAGKDGGVKIALTGPLTVSSIGVIDRQLRSIPDKVTTVDLSGIAEIDTVGAWTAWRIARDNDAEIVGADEKATQQIAIDVEADKLRAVKVYVTVSPQSLSEVQTGFTFTVVEEMAGVAPENRRRLAIFHAPPKEPNP